MASDIEQGQLSLLTPRRELTEIQCVGVAGQSRDAEKAEQRLMLDGAEHAIGASLH